MTIHAPIGTNFSGFRGDISLLHHHVDLRAHHSPTNIGGGDSGAQLLVLPQENVKVGSFGAIVQRTFDFNFPLNAVIASSLFRQRVALQSLKENWDGYGASPVSDSVIASMFEILIGILTNVDCAPPDIVPGADGSLQAEWRSHQLEVFFNLQKDGNISLLVDYLARKVEFEFAGQEAIEALAKWTLQLPAATMVVIQAA